MHKLIIIQINSISFKSLEDKIEIIIIKTIPAKIAPCFNLFLIGDDLVIANIAPVYKDKNQIIKRYTPNDVLKLACNTCSKITIRIELTNAAAEIKNHTFAVKTVLKKFFIFSSLPEKRI